MRLKALWMMPALALTMTSLQLTPTYAAVKLSAKTASIVKGKTKTLTIKGTKKKVSWSSSNKKIASVTSKGKVKGLRAGKVTIKAKVSGKTYRCAVTVKNPSPYISPTSVTLNVRGSKTLKLAYNKKKVKWSSSNKKIVTINSKGKVTAKKTGKATIYAKVGKKRYSRKVTVVNPKLSASKAMIYVGAKKTLKLNKAYGTVKWTSSKPSVASVTAKGVVTGQTAGSATIKATINGQAYSCKVTVPVMSLTKTSVTLTAGQKADVNIRNCKATAVWSSANSAVASVVKGGIITGVSAGTTTVNAQVGTTILSTQVIVNAPAAPVPVTTPKTSFDTVRTTTTAGVVGQTIKVTSTLGSSGTYTSSDPTTALVSKAGLVMPLKAGTVTITNTKNNAAMFITITDPGNVEVGVDVSYHNGNVDFNKMKAAGVDFAIIRGGNTLKKLSTTNSDGIDLNLKTNIDKAEAAGMKYGVYWYMNASSNSGLMTTDQASAQATMLATYLSQYKTSQFTMPIYLDLEQTSALITGSNASEKVANLQTIVETFTNTLKAYGYNNIGIYSSTSWYKNYLQSAYYVTNFNSLWQAHYGYNSVTGSSMTNYTTIPSYTYNGVTYYPDLWQTGSDFKIDGISGYVDMNYKYN